MRRLRVMRRQPLWQRGWQGLLVSTVLLIGCWVTGALGQSVFPTNGNNAGIGTISPRNPLDIKASPSGGNAQQLRLSNGSSAALGNNSSVLFDFQNSTGTQTDFAQIVVESLDMTSPNETARMLFYTTIGDGILLPRLVIDRPNGYVGIGTHIPKNPLEISVGGGNPQHLRLSNPSPASAGNTGTILFGFQNDTGVQHDFAQIVIQS